MTTENYFYSSEESIGDMTYYEEQLLLNYDDYLDAAFEAELTASNHFNLELGDLEDDMDSEYDENDWEEVESDEEFDGEYDKNEENPGTFLMKNYN